MSQPTYTRAELEVAACSLRNIGHSPNMGGTLCEEADRLRAHRTDPEFTESDMWDLGDAMRQWRLSRPNNSSPTWVDAIGEAIDKIRCRKARR